MTTEINEETGWSPPHRGACVKHTEAKPKQNTSRRLLYGTVITLFESSKISKLEKSHMVKTEKVGKELV
jgi:hypothetical protein